MEAENTAGIYASAGAVGSICALLTSWVKSHVGQKTRLEPCPLPVKKEPQYVTVGEFNTRCGKIENDISTLRDEINGAKHRIVDKLDELDKRSEQRAIALNHRIDPIIEKVAANADAVDFIKAAAIKTTIGGKK